MKTQLQSRLCHHLHSFLAQFTMPFNREHTLKYYATDKELAEDIVKAYGKVINDLYEAGCRNIQLDDCTWGNDGR